VIVVSGRGVKGHHEDFMSLIPNFSADRTPKPCLNLFHYNESPKVVTPIAPVYSMRSADLSQLPSENLGSFHRFKMHRSIKLINSALDVGPASFFASGDQIPFGREKHGDLDNPANFMICQTVIV
jgi:hypothetical protein